MSIFTQKNKFWNQARRDYFAAFGLAGLLLFALAYFDKVELEHDGYQFSFPLTVRNAKTLFHLNEKVSNGRIARLDSKGCKEIQITMDIWAKDSSRAHKVEAVSFYHAENMDYLKENLEHEYGDRFEPVYYYHSRRVHYYLMYPRGFTIILYPINFRACINNEASPQKQLKHSDKLSVVAFTTFLTEESEFDAFVTLDGFWRE